MQDPGVMFFGGQDWDQCEGDLRNVPENDRTAFVLCLFIVVISDQNIYSHFRGQYANWRTRTQFPKFGWSGFGPHNENPLKILVVPVRRGVVDVAAIEASLPEAMELLVNEVERFVTGQIQISPAEFFTRMLGDPAFQQMVNEPVVQRTQEYFARLWGKGASRSD